MVDLLSRRRLAFGVGRAFLRQGEPLTDWRQASAASRSGEYEEQIQLILRLGKGDHRPSGRRGGRDYVSLLS